MNPLPDDRPGFDCRGQPPPPVLEQLSYQFLRAAHLLGQQLRQMVAAHGLNRSQGAILGLLHHAGEDLTASDLTRRLGLTAASMSKLLAQMEQEGLIVRTPHPQDARALLIRLTSQGERRLQVFPQILEVLDSRALAGFSPEERARLRDFLARLRANLEALQKEEATIASEEDLVEDTN